MDNSPPQGPGLEQKAAAEDTGYQQYLDPGNAPKKNQKKLILFITTGILGFLIIFVVVLALLGKHSKQDNQIPSQVTVVCKDETCFTDHFAQCLPAIYTYDESAASVKYSITGNGEVGCNVRMEYLKAQYSPDEVGKNMTCDFDNTIDFQAAAQNVFHFPDDYSCQGDLAELLQTSGDTSGSTD